MKCYYLRSFIPMNIYSYFPPFLHKRYYSIHSIIYVTLSTQQCYLSIFPDWNIGNFLTLGFTVAQYSISGSQRIQLISPLLHLFFFKHKETSKQNFKMSVSKENTYTTHTDVRLQIFQNGFRMNRVKKLLICQVLKQQFIENILQKTYLESKYLSVTEKKNVSVHSAILFFNILNEDTFLFKVYQRFI